MAVQKGEGRFGVNSGYVTMRGRGQKRLVYAAGDLKVFMPLPPVL